MNENIGGNKSVFTVKNAMRFLTLLCIIFVFCPSFLVSCSNQTIDVSVITAVNGVEFYGEQVVEPQLFMIVCLLIPAVLLTLLFIKKFSDVKTSGIILGLIVVDLLIWIAFRHSVKKIAFENYSDVETTGWYVLNIISILIITGLSALVTFQKTEMGTDIGAFFSGGGTQKALDKISTAVNQMSNGITQMAENVNKRSAKDEDIIGYCAKCGSSIMYDFVFCTSCGTAVPESMIAEAQTKKPESKLETSEVEKR
jgi:hypothetical protein